MFRYTISKCKHLQSLLFGTIDKLKNCLAYDEQALVNFCYSHVAEIWCFALIFSGLNEPLQIPMVAYALCNQIHQNACKLINLLLFPLPVLIRFWIGFYYSR